MSNRKSPGRVARTRRRAAERATREKAGEGKQSISRRDYLVRETSKATPQLTIQEQPELKQGQQKEVQPQSVPATTGLEQTLNVGISGRTPSKIRRFLQLALRRLKKLWKHPHSVRVQSSGKLGWRLFAAFSSIVSALGIVFFWPRVDVQVGPTLDATTPFENRFTLQNGPLPLRDVWYLMEWTPGDGTPVVFASSGFSHIAALSWYAKITLQFPHLDKTADLPFYAGAGPRTLPQDRAFARIRVFYTLPGFKKVRVFDKYFYTIKDHAGNFQWFHDDSSREWAGNYLPRFQDRSRTLRTSDVMAFLDVSEFEVENISATNSERPLQIDYRLRNIGGIPATDVHVEWAVLDTQTPNVTIQHTWTNEAPIMAVKEGLLPNMTKMIRVRYPDPRHPFLFDNILSGKFILLGAVGFKDIDGHDYNAFIKATHVRDRFEIRYLHLGGRFEEVEKRAAPLKPN